MGNPAASDRSGSSPGTPTIRLAATRRRLMAARFSPFLGPKAAPVSWGLANGSKAALVQSSSIAVIELGLAEGIVVPPGEEVDGAVVVDGADHPVEVHDAVEELPGHVALEGAKETVDGHHVPAGGPLDVDEVLIAAERELSEGEAPIAVRVGLGRLDGGCCLNAHGTLSLGIRSPRPAGHDRVARLRSHMVWQMSAHRYCVSSPAIVCSRITAGRSAWNW